MATTELGDVTIYYEEVGKGPLPVIFCKTHALGSGDMYKGEPEQWQADFGRAMTWDYRGMGQSSRATKYSLPLVASDLARLLDKLEIGSVILYGYLWGGFFAQQFALDYPEKCAAMILDSSASETNVAASERWYQSSEKARQDPEVPEEDRDFLVFAHRTLAGLREHPFTPRLKNITCPVLLLGGGKDAMGGAPAAVIMSRNLPNCKLNIVQEAGHGLIRERPREVQKLAVEFCREYGVI